MIEFKAYASSSAGNLYEVVGEKSSLMLECGLPIREIRKYYNFDFSRVAGTLLTHEHLDHARAVKDIMASGINLYCSPGTADILKLSGHRLHVSHRKQIFKIGEWTILPFEVQHDAKEPYGYLIANGAERLLFITDSYFVKHRFNNLTSIAIECNYAKALISEDLNPVRKRRLLRSHMSLENLKDFFRANDMSSVREIHLLHLSDNHSDEGLFESEIQKLTGKPVFVAPKRQRLKYERYYEFEQK